jgi:outer membrane protein OmpA-like peptidoglycan-associated protein
LSFEHNGFDVKDATIGLLEDKSSRMVSSTFEVNFAPRSYSLPSDPICELKFDISGRYDPFGPGVSSFQGQLRVKADGKTFLALTSENNAVVAGRFFHVKTQALFPRSTTPNSIDVYFGVGSDRVDERSIRAIRAWFDQLSTAARQQVTLGLIPVALDAFASTTGSAAVNQALAQRRAAAVERILRDFAGSNAQFKTTVHGELAAKTGDRVEDARERRVTISVKSFN